MRTLKALVSLPQRYLIGATSTRLAGSHNKVDARKRPCCLAQLGVPDSSLDNGQSLRGIRPWHTSWLWGIFAVTLLI